MTAKNFRIGFLTWLAFGIVVFTALFPISARAQLPFLPEINSQTFKLDRDPGNIIASSCVRLDGHCLFKVVERQSNLSFRIEQIERQIKEASRVYLENPDAKLNVRTDKKGLSQNIYASIGEQEILLMTLSSQDTSYEGLHIELQAYQKADKIKEGLERAKLERQKSYLIEQSKVAGAILLATILTTLILADCQKKLKQAKQQFKTANIDLLSLSVENQLEQKQKFNFKEAQLRIFQLLKIAVWGGALLLILGLYPYTRTIELWLVTIFRIPLRIFIITWIIYILIRLSYALIAKLNSTLTNSYVLSREANRRLQQRVTTISYLFKGIVAFIWISLGVVATLMVLGINVAPLLAGAGILGLAFSFASQNLIKDALNGFFIILEDQYAVGDVIKVGDVSGLVERLNLRITQLRDGEGRLITVPNSAIQVVANHSNGWSRSDIQIPIAYNSDIDKAIKIIEEVTEDINQDAVWQEKILEPPQVLGVENFAERGLMIRVWIKTEPLKQWEVSREFRRRVKKALELEGIPLPLSQQEIWLHR